MLESEKNMLQKHVIELKHENLDLKKCVDDNQQYDRWPCLRTDEVPAAEKESSDVVLRKYKKYVRRGWY